jgi:O-acetyl-ADP-ribose deacetylase (regulator of RNase III)
MLVYETGLLTNPRFIINFPTKRHWRGNAHIEDIDSGLIALIEEIRQRGIQSIAIPPLGAGLGGLDWNVVRRRIENALQDLVGVTVLVYEPTGTPDAANGARKGKVPRMTAGRAALVGLIERYLGGLLDPFVSLLEVHKLMYFLQEAGEPLRLRFAKAPYGPYAENLRHVLHAIEGYYVSGYGVGGDSPNKALELVPGAAADARRAIQHLPEARERFERVSKLVAGFESPFGLELLATVHRVLSGEQVNDDDDLVMHTYSWAERKRQFSARQIRLAANVLRDQRWLRR